MRTSPPLLECQWAWDKKCIFSQRNESSALLTLRTHWGLANKLLARLLARELVPLHPTARANYYTIEAILKHKVDSSVHLKKNGAVHDKRWVDLTQRAHSVPKNQSSLLCRRAEPANALAS